MTVQRGDLNYHEVITIREGPRATFSVGHELPDSRVNGSVHIWSEPADKAGDIWLYKDRWYDITAVWLTTPVEQADERG